jgi:hypothetical protein
MRDSCPYQKLDSTVSVVQATTSFLKTDHLENQMGPLGIKWGQYRGAKFGHCGFQNRPLASETGQYPPG